MALAVAQAKTAAKMDADNAYLTSGKVSI